MAQNTKLLTGSQNTKFLTPSAALIYIEPDVVESVIAHHGLTWLLESSYIRHRINSHCMAYARKHP